MYNSSSHGDRRLALRQLIVADVALDLRRDQLLHLLGVRGLLLLAQRRHELSLRAGDGLRGRNGDRRLALRQLIVADVALDLRRDPLLPASARRPRPGLLVSASDF